MNLEKKGYHLGVIGVETAIILISAVLVAAALLAVVFNAGFATIQKTKSFIIAGVIESRSSLIVSGSMVGIASIVEDKLNATAIPIKVAMSGSEPINIRAGDATVRYITQDIKNDDIYTHVIVDWVYSNLQDAMQKAVSDGMLLRNPN